MREPDSHKFAFHPIMLQDMMKPRRGEYDRPLSLCEVWGYTVLVHTRTYVLLSTNYIIIHICACKTYVRMEAGLLTSHY